MMKRRAIQVFWGCVLMLLVAGGIGPDGSRAANGQAVVVPPPAPAAVSTGGSKAKTAPATVTPSIPEAKTAPAAVSTGPEAKTAPTASVTTPAAAPTPAYRYQAEGKADPFVPFLELDLAAKKQKEEALKKMAASRKLPVSPLQLADIGRFRLVGIAGDEHRRMAIVEDGVAKKYYPLFVGTNIGLNGGRVVSILPDRVIVEERLEGQTKNVRKAEIKRSSIMLRKEEGQP
ncbi:MAG: pilus assembly protein PilP [Syntrophales bacterium]